MFREYVFEKAVYSLVTPGYTSETILGPNRDGKTLTCQTLEYCQLLSQSSTTLSLQEKDYCGSEHGDEVSKWWASVLTVGANWLTGNNAAIFRHYPIIDSYPTVLEELE